MRKVSDLTRMGVSRPHSQACFHPEPGEQSPRVSEERGPSLGLWDAGAPDQANPQENLRILCPALFQTTTTRRKWSVCGQHEEEARKTQRMLHLPTT